MTVPYSHFTTIIPDRSRTVTAVNETTRLAAARLAGPGLASLPEIADYLRIGRRGVADILTTHRTAVLRTRRVPWGTLWKTLWQIPDVPTEVYDVMKVPLLTVAEVAEITGMSTRSILRDGDRARSAYELPRHVQLSERKRRYHPEMMRLWCMQQPLEDWMRPAKTRPSGSARALRPRNTT